MIATIVTNPNFAINAKSLPEYIAFASFANGVYLLNELAQGKADTPYGRLWQGHEGSLMSYCVVLYQHLNTTVTNEDIRYWLLGFKRRMNLLGIETNDNAPAWTTDVALHEKHKQFLKSEDESFLSPCGL